MAAVILYGLAAASLAVANVPRSAPVVAVYQRVPVTVHLAAGIISVGVLDAARMPQRPSTVGRRERSMTRPIPTPRPPLAPAPPRLADVAASAVVIALATRTVDADWATTTSRRARNCWYVSSARLTEH